MILNKSKIMSSHDLIELNILIKALKQIESDVRHRNDSPIIFNIKNFFLQRFHKNHGICVNTNWYVNKIVKDASLNISISSTIAGFYKYWEYYSGNLGYPVPPDKQSIELGKQNIELGKKARVAYQNRKDCWNLKTEYGELRYNLLQFLIKELEQYASLSCRPAQTS